ncbi:VCBS repeat-containing protein [Pollutibacter soli]|uniref:VCBS repeat-containing protein n=1 Tax=Pollutibacter soli TaxID=3034157 RepID=UPI00301389DB
MRKRILRLSPKHFGSARVQLTFLVLLSLSFANCKTDLKRFTRIASSHSGLTFQNTVIENDSINPLDLEFLYNGGGVAVGDFNNDSLPDLYFTASMVPNKLYLNKDKFRFDDVTDISKTTGEGRWANGASVVDINNDGWLDIYVSTTIKKNPNERKNLLYINQGLNENKIPVFKEMAEEYGLADTSWSVQASFFDYDNDGDLDMYLMTTKLARRAAVDFSGNKIDPDLSDIDKLFRNDPNESLGHPVFTDVSKEAGIIHAGFGLGLSVADINLDGWKDIYVANDFFGSDLLYINNKKGGFTNEIKSYLKHTSQNAMGNDIADINNDGLADIFSVDMNPEDNFRKKKNLNGSNYYIYQKQIYEDLMLQYVRNTFQLNMGPAKINDSVTHPVFGDISFYTGTAETDWSWSVLMVDGDNDGYRDIFITNGYPKDVTDHDFASFRYKSERYIAKQDIISEIPQIKIPNYVFHNKGDLQFENTTVNWGMNESIFSNGAAAVDLDNDGDLDYVVNNINDEVLLYKNTTRNGEDTAGSNFLFVQFKGDAANRNGIGAIASIYYNGGQQQVYENSPVRGYLSSADPKAFFGLGQNVKVDSLVIIWPGDQKQVMKNVSTNQRIIADIKNADRVHTWNHTNTKPPLFEDYAAASDLHFRHQERDYIDFDKEKLIPHKLSEYGPQLAVADIDGDGLEDFYVGGSGDYAGKFFLQKSDGKFIQKELPAWVGKDARRPENTGVLFFDADNDGDPDLYCASGSNEYPANTKNYQDQFFINDGNGTFVFDTSNAFPQNYTSKSCVRAADYDNDGDLDLFLGGRCLPGKYPYPVSSFIYRNDSEKGNIKFTNVTDEIAPVLKSIGMVCDAIWTDFNNDKVVDLVIVGEGMPVTFLKNSGGNFTNNPKLSGVESSIGAWNSIVAGDFNGDGLMDYVAGNLGLNSFYRAPVSIYAKDFDGNGDTESIVTVFLKDKDGVKREFPAFNRDDIVSQLPGLKKKILTYKEFGNADINTIFGKEKLADALKITMTNFASCLLLNKGDGRFEITPLPQQAQFSPVFGMVADDFDGDGRIDIALNGNDFGNEVTNGRYDAFNGLILKGNGKGGFRAMLISESGFYIPGNGKALVKLKGSGNSYMLVGSENRGMLRVFRKN